MSHIDLRDWLAAVESHGDLRRVEGANWDLEMSSIVEFIYREGKTPKPALMFDEVSSYPKGFRTLFGMLGSTWRIAKTLDLPEDEISPLEVADDWYKKSKRNGRPLLQTVYSL